MFERQMMITGLQKQQRILSELIQEIEVKDLQGDRDWSLLSGRTRQVAHNLRKLRKIKSGYFGYGNTSVS